MVVIRRLLWIPSWVPLLLIRMMIHLHLLIIVPGLSIHGTLTRMALDPQDAVLHCLRLPRPLLRIWRIRSLELPVCWSNTILAPRMPSKRLKRRSSISSVTSGPRSPTRWKVIGLWCVDRQTLSRASEARTSFVFLYINTAPKNTKFVR
jgi:hypothetical protein